MMYVFLFICWLIGAAFTHQATRELGLRNPDTIYDSFSGDDSLDAIIIAFWPLFWPCWVAAKLGGLSFKE